MAFIILTSDDGEIGRQALEGPVVVGRSPECAVSVRDVRMSRQHCRIEPMGEGWAIADLGSKNGTLLKGEPVQLRVLEDGDELLLGRTRLKYHSGPLIPAPAEVKKASASKNGRRRPADPMEAFSDTMSGVVLDLYPHQGPARPVERLPVPAPRPADPDGYASDGVYSMLSELVSSSWDSIYASNARPAAVKVAGQQPRSVRRPPVAPQPPNGVEQKQGEAPPTDAVSVEPGAVTSESTERELPEWAQPVRPRYPRSAFEAQAKMQLQADPAEVIAAGEPKPLNGKSVAAAAEEPRRLPRPPAPPVPESLSLRWLRSVAEVGRRVGRVARQMFKLVGPGLLMIRLMV